MDKKEIKKSKVKASLLSAFVFPGVGQIYNKEKIKGIILILLFFSFIIINFLLILFNIIDAIKAGDISVIQNPTPENILVKNLFWIKVLAYCKLFIWAYSIIDAYKGAKK
jgi:arabinogalactan oligomer/maltooligosaccharide transport system permease protein